MGIAGKLFVLQALIIVLICLPGCRSEYPFRAEEQELDDMWPNGDGMFWSFDYTLNQAGYICIVEIYDNIDNVPDLPTLDEIEALLDEDPFPDEFWTRSGSYQLMFDGLIRTESGARGQNLVGTVSLESYYDPDDSIAVDAGASLIDRLALYRPDLREKIISMGYMERDEMPAAIVPKVPGPSPVPDIDYILQQSAPLFLHGGAWEKRREYIGLYGDLDRLLAWKFLERDLSEGHEFTLQLARSLDDNIFLHCRILERKSVITPYSEFDDALVCLYAVDYGIGLVHSENPLEDYYYRLFDYGTVTYAPHFGPISCYERLFNDVSRSSTCCVERILEIESSNVRR